MTSNKLTAGGGVEKKNISNAMARKAVAGFGLRRRSVAKVVAWTLIVALNYSGLMSVGRTGAYFNDMESADNNAFTASSLDFSLDLLRWDGFHTQTQGGWGADPQGVNSGAYLQDNFYKAFPEGLTIGDGLGLAGFSAHFTSSTDINNFLPAEGAPAVFSQNHLNPAATEAGVLAGQAVALTLNLGFDIYDADFSTNTSKLSDFKANSSSSPCANLTAGEVLTEANKVLAGNFSLFTPSAINDCVTEINERFDNGALLKITPDEPAVREITISNDAELGFQHQLTVEQSSGDSDFCQGLLVDAYLNGNLLYTGNLSGLTHAPVVFSPTSTNHWLLQIALSTDAPVGWQNKSCGLKYKVAGWQETLSSSSEGFWDEEEVYDEILSGNWSKVLINKVYYDVDAAHGADSNNEWVELYNPSDNPIDLSGWKICDNTSCDNLPASTTASTIIPAGGLAIITYKTSTWNFWEIPAGVIKIALNSPIGNGLSNSSDRVILKTADNIEIDAMSYGTDKYAFDPACPDVARGHMLGRVPTGLDTDQASDFKDLNLPQVTVLVPNGGEVWWVGRTSTVEWLATNPNGTDDQLKVDLWYSKDSGNTWGNIVKGAENNGSYSFRVPLCLDDGHGGCYYTPSHNARIKVVVWGPENFMVQNQDMSDADFCPPIDYDLLLPEEIELLKTLGIMIEEIPAPIDEPAETSTSTESTTTDAIIDNPVTSTDEAITETATTTAPAADPATSGAGETSAPVEPPIEQEPALEPQTVELPDAPPADDNNSDDPESITEPAVQSEPQVQPEQPSEAPVTSDSDSEPVPSADLPVSS